ncbi:MAG: hypothetical protein MUE85_21040 [Microscillaceae bacterium]|jgi:ligand-binding SRPBCC domain-containing protein|nr:hypothetical protein [Microscillaceae bacterium]
MAREFHFRIDSILTASPAQVWQHANNFDGVNYELMPWAKMTAGASTPALSIEALPTGKNPFKSWILLFGFIPFDLHYLGMEKVSKQGFSEKSYSFWQKLWKHERRLMELGNNCLVVDEVTFSPRIALLGYLLKPIFMIVFRHRHYQLWKKFGVIA